MTPEELDALLAAPASQPATPAAPAPQAPSGATPPVDPQAQPQAAPEAAAAPAAPADPGAAPSSPMDERYDLQGQIGGAILTGAAKSIYETKDFVFGKPAEADKSETRRSIEKFDKDLGEAHIANSFVSGLSQFATGMLGAGKIASVAKAIPKVGAAAGAIESTKAGAWALSSGKAATVGAVAFDPNGGRLSDLVMKFPALQNPVSEFLASAPGDSAALGRAKNALESIGVDAALAGVFAASVAGFKALRGGDQAAIAASQLELVQAVAHKDAKLAASKGDVEGVEQLRQSHPEAVQQAEEALALQQPKPPEATPKPDPAADVTLSELAVEADSPGTKATRVDNPTQGAGELGLPSAAKLLNVSEEQLSNIIVKGQADTAAILGPGGWEGALERGYKFGEGGSIPWQKFARVSETGPDPLDLMVARVADELSSQLSKVKGGDAEGVLHDAQVDRMVQQRVALWNEDPEALLGHLQLAGAQARTMAINMEAGFLVSQRVMQDALNLRSRIGLGMLEEFGGSLPAARAALEENLQVAATAFAQAQAIRGSAGRSMRRLRGDFAFTPEDLAGMKGLDDAKFFSLLDAVGHDFRVANRLVKPGFWSRLKDDAAYLYVNNLLWGLRTHFVNLSTNSYMLLGRPLERMIGYGVKWDKEGFQENFKQYAYMGASLSDSFRDAVRTWKTGDSVMAPHSVETSPQGIADAGRGTNWAVEGYKPWDSIPNVLSNAYTGFMKGAGLPTRALGTVDELVKQVVYRSKVQSEAHASGVAAGLDAPALSEHVRQTLNEAFDDSGRAVNLSALEEANIATFQQDLLPDTVGKTVQNIVANHEMMRFVIPFVKTPTNVIRMGVKLTPGLNMLQQEYRQMIRGAMGEEKQAQAMGQMALGSLFLGTAAYLATQGYVTGGGPSDKNLADKLRATGWQPYSFVVANADGSKSYVNFGRYDPVALPFGIVADIVDIVSRDQDGDGFADRAWEAASGLLVALTKQMTQKTYLTSLHDTLDAVMDPDRNMAKVAGATAANFVPFSSGLRFWNPDPYMREARGVVDKIKATVPGLSEKLPPRRDVFGDPMTIHRGLWVDGEKTAVDAEIRRMVDEAGAMFGPPSYTHNGVDLRDVTMKDGRNAFDALQEMAGHPKRGPSLKDTVARLIQMPAYGKAPDGDAATKGTKLAMLTGTISKYRDAAFKQLKADENVRVALAKRDAEARAAYTSAKAPKSNKQEGAGAIQALGESFGVELGGLLPQ